MAVASRSFVDPRSVGPGSPAGADLLPRPALADGVCRPTPATSTRLLQAARLFPTEAPLAPSVERFLRSTSGQGLPIDGAADGAATDPVVVVSEGAVRAPSEAFPPIGPTACCGVRVDGIVTHAPGCSFPAASAWPEASHGLSPECKALTMRTWGLE